MNNNHITVLDGIRGIAILFVLFYHIGIAKSGFLGVDIFFILSGFLITLVIQNQIEKNNFLFKSFYMKQVFRIFPMAIIVLLISFIVSFQILFTIEFEEFLRYFYYAITLRSNILSMQELDYFDLGVNFKPLIHYWSLAVEIHFYLVIPIILYFFLRKNQIKQLFIVLSIFIFISIIYSIVYSEDNANYFSTFSRIYEFLIGVILFLFYKNNKKKYNVSRKFFNLLNFVILFFISYIIVIDWELSSSIKSLYISILISILILSNIMFNYKNIFLENKILSYIGLISYSLYLVHYPVLAFSRIILGRELFFNESLILLIIIFLISILSYKYIEKPFMSSNSNSKYYILICLILISVFIIIFKSNLINIVRMKDNSVEKYLQYKNDNHPDIINSRINSLVNFDNIYKYEGVNPQNIIVLWGDSHMNQISNHLANELNKNGYDVYEFSVAGCPPIKEVESKDKRRKCNDNSKKILEYIVNNKNIKKVVLFAYWKYYQENNLTYINKLNDSYKVNFFNKFEKTINSIISSNKDISVILPTPVMNINPPLFIAREYKLFGNLLNQKELCISKYKYELESLAFINFVKELSYNNSRVNIANLHQYLISEGSYCSILKNELLYRDNNHLTNSFGMKYSKKIVSQILKKD